MFLQETNDLEFQTLELRGNLLCLCVVFSLRIPDVGVVIVRDVLHCEDLAVLLRFLVLWPEGRIGLKRTKGESSLLRAELD